jgi:hypothetical protein
MPERVNVLFIRHIALPTDHGSWVFLLSPLLIGIACGGRVRLATLFFCMAALATFLIRQPITVAIKAYSGRRSRRDLRPAWFWIIIYALIGLISAAGLVWNGFSYLFILALPGIPVFAWHLYLVSRRRERRQAGVEIVASGALALAAPGAYWIASSNMDPIGWWLFILTWFQSAASIVYAYLRLAQRELKSLPDYNERLRMGWRALLYTGSNLVAVIILEWQKVLPAWLFLPYLLQFAETAYGTLNPAIGWKPTAVGLRQLAVSSLFTIMFIVAWYL